MADRIALVDDDQNILTSVSLTLESEGFEVDCYNDGEAACAVGSLRLVLEGRPVPAGLRHGSTNWGERSGYGSLLILLTPLPSACAFAAASAGLSRPVGRKPPEEKPATPRRRESGRKWQPPALGE